jgi:hypothetical protein
MINEFGPGILLGDRVQPESQALLGRVAMKLLRKDEPSLAAAIDHNLANRFDWLKPSEWTEWDAFVESHPWGSLYHTSAWMRFLESTFSHIAGQVAVLRNAESHRIVAGIPICMVRSRFLGTRCISIPYGMTCDPLIDSADQGSLLFENLKLELAAVHSCHLEIKTHHLPEIFSPRDFAASSNDLCHSLAIDEPEDTLWARFSKGNKWSIRKAQKNGITLQESDERNPLDRFYNLHRALRKRLRLPPFKMAFFDNLRRHMGSSRCSILFALQGNKDIASVLAIRFRDTMMWEYSGDSEIGRAVGANNLLIWAAIKHARALGCKQFCLGRTEKANIGLTEFKRSWGSVETGLRTYIYPPSVISQKLDTRGSLGYRMIRIISGSAPAPIARIIGAFCYRHWG